MKETCWENLNLNINKNLFDEKKGNLIKQIFFFIIFLMAFDVKTDI